MPVPIALDPRDLLDYLQEVEGRLAALETPQGFSPAYITTSASLTVTNAAEASQRWAIISDLKTVAYSTGSHWIRADTGAQIV